MDLVAERIGGTLDASSITGLNVTSQCFDCNNYENIGKKVLPTSQNYSNNFNASVQSNTNVGSSTMVGNANTKHSRPVGNGKELVAGSKDTINVAKVSFGISYDIKDSRCVVEVSTFALEENGKCLGDDWLVFYGNKTSPDNAISYHEDDANKASGVYEDKIVDVNMSGLNPQVNKIAVVLTIDEALENNLNVSMLDNVTLSCKDSYNNEIFKFKLQKYSSELTAVALAELYKHNGQWKIKIVGEGVKRDLAGLCEFYGLEVG